METIETKEIVTFEELYNQSKTNILNIITFLEQRAYSATCEVLSVIRKELSFYDLTKARSWYEEYLIAREKEKIYEEYLIAREKEKIYNDILDNVASIISN